MAIDPILPPGANSPDAEFALVQSLGAAALRKTPAVERTTEANLSSTEVLGFLNDCSVIRRGSLEFGVRLREHRLGQGERAHPPAKTFEQIDLGPAP